MLTTEKYIMRGEWSERFVPSVLRHHRQKHYVYSNMNAILQYTQHSLFCFSLFIYFLNTKIVKLTTFDKSRNARTHTHTNAYAHTLVYSIHMRALTHKHKHKRSDRRRFSNCAGHVHVVRSLHTNIKRRRRQTATTMMTKTATKTTTTTTANGQNTLNLSHTIFTWYIFQELPVSVSRGPYAKPISQEKCLCSFILSFTKYVFILLKIFVHLITFPAPITGQNLYVFV